MPPASRPEASLRASSEGEERRPAWRSFRYFPPAETVYPPHGPSTGTGAGGRSGIA